LVSAAYAPALRQLPRVCDIWEFGLVQRLENLNHLPPHPVCPELVEGSFFFERQRAMPEEKGSASTSSA
jgi:hypothetical protein